MEIFLQDNKFRTKLSIVSSTLYKTIDNVNNYIIHTTFRFISIPNLAPPGIRTRDSHASGMLRS